MDASQSAVWLLGAKKNGSFSKAVRVDALEELDFRLCEFSVKKGPSEHRTVAFYLPSTNMNRASRGPRGPRGPVLLFCVFMDHQKRKLEYLGSIEANEDSKLHSICFDHICELVEGAKRVECSFFCVHPDERMTPIRMFQKTVKEVRLSPL